MSVGLRNVVCGAEDQLYFSLHAAGPGTREMFESERVRHSFNPTWLMVHASIDRDASMSKRAASYVLCVWLVPRSRDRDAEADALVDASNQYLDLAEEAAARAADAADAAAAAVLASQHAMAAVAAVAPTSSSASSSAAAAVSTPAAAAQTSAVAARLFGSSGSRSRIASDVVDDDEGAIFGTSAQPHRLSVRSSARLDEKDAPAAASDSAAAAAAATATSGNAPASATAAAPTASSNAPATPAQPTSTAASRPAAAVSRGAVAQPSPSRADPLNMALADLERYLDATTDGEAAASEEPDAAVEAPGADAAAPAAATPTPLAADTPQERGDTPNALAAMPIVPAVSARATIALSRRSDTYVQARDFPERVQAGHRLMSQFLLDFPDLEFLGAQLDGMQFPYNSVVLELSDGFYAPPRIARMLNLPPPAPSPRQLQPPATIDFGQYQRRLFDVWNRHEACVERRELCRSMAARVSTALARAGQLDAVRRERMETERRVQKLTALRDSLQRRLDEQLAEKQRVVDLHRTRTESIIDVEGSLKSASGSNQADVASLQADRHLALCVRKALCMRRAQLVADLRGAFPITLLPWSVVPLQRKDKDIDHSRARLEEYCFAISGMPLLPSHLLGECDDVLASGALGTTALLVSRLADYLQVPLRFPIRFSGSRTTIVDPIGSHVDPVFPLFRQSQSTERFSFAVWLLNKDVEQLLTSQGLITHDVRMTLYNLSKLMSFEKAGWSLAHRFVILQPAHVTSPAHPAAALPPVAPKGAQPS